MGALFRVAVADYAEAVGVNMRKDFTIVGNAINFAARLMMNATNHGASLDRKSVV